MFIGGCGWRARGRAVVYVRALGAVEVWGLCINRSCDRGRLT